MNIFGKINQRFVEGQPGKPRDRVWITAAEGQEVQAIMEMEFGVLATVGSVAVSGPVYSATGRITSGMKPAAYTRQWPVPGDGVGVPNPDVDYVEIEKRIVAQMVTMMDQSAHGPQHIWGQVQEAARIPGNPSANWVVRQSFTVLQLIDILGSPAALDCLRQSWKQETFHDRYGAKS